MKIAFITAGAAGMFCGSCMKDNTLAAALGKLGHDAQLIPTYTPIRTDEEDVSQQKIFLGGVNVFLQQKSWLFRHTPRFIDRLLNGRGLLRWVSRFAVRTKADQLGGLTVSMLMGSDGKQNKAIEELVDFLVDDFQPDVVLLTNLLLSGFIPELSRRSTIPVYGILQGDDIFLESLPENDRKAAIDLIGKNCKTLAGNFVTCRAYADFMSGYLAQPREMMHVVYPGINLKGHGGDRPFRDSPPYTIGYFARICAEKGFDNLVDAFIRLKQLPGQSETKLRASGWLGENNRSFFEQQVAKLREAQILDSFNHVESPTHADKVRFLQSIDVLSVPTSYHEPKGLYILEALANGTPVVQPAHGSFPEWIEMTGGGILVKPDDPVALAEGLKAILDDVEGRRRMAEAGRRAVTVRFHAEAMARATLDVIGKQCVSRTESPI